MSSNHQEKWQKYFSSGAVDTKIKAKSGERIVVYDKSGNTIDFLEDGHQIHVPASKEYNQRYLIEYKKSALSKMGFVNQSYVAKPGGKGTGTETLSVRAETLISLGQSKEIDFSGQKIKVKSFTSADTLIASIVKGLKDNKNVSEGIEDVFENYAKSKKYTEIKWTSEVAQNEVDQLGKYAGELIVGLLALSKNESGFNRKIYEGSPVEFCIPVDPTFAGVDSFLLMQDGKIVPISSKYGVGAKASLFANLLPKAIKYSSKLPNSVLKGMCESARSVGVTSQMLEQRRGAKEILYHYGITKVLKLNISNTYGIFTELKTKKSVDGLSKDASAVLEAIRKYPGVDKKIVDKLPMSVTAFFCRTIADQLNRDSASVQAMLDILAGKNFWQANLDINAWKSGKVYYKFVNSGNSIIKVIGSKAAIDDIEAKQGMINYEIQLPR